MSDDPDHDGLTGEVLASRYRVEALIGEGAMGAVYRARHVKVGRAFAVKVLHPRFSGDERTRKRFAREAEVAGTLHHANVVSVVDVGDLADGRRYLVMEYAEGVTLLDLINETAPMSPARVIGLVRQLCNGLQHAHELGLIHRDFKPDNVIVERDRHGNETPRIVDFGTAILREQAAATGDERLTTQGLVLGTPHYMSPEHATGSPIDHRIDLFALGVTCFEMLTGHSPFEGDGVDVARANLLQDTPVMSVRVPGLEVDPLLEAFTRKLMMKARDARPATANAARQLLDLIEHDRPAAAAALGVTLDEPRPPAAVPMSAVSQPIPFEMDPDVAASWPDGQAAAPPPGWQPPAPVPWPTASATPAWRSGARAPSTEPPTTRFKSRPEATEQILYVVRSRPLRLVLPAIAAVAVVFAMVIAIRGGHGKPTAKVVEFSQLRAAGTPAPSALPAPTPAAPASPSTAAMPGSAAAAPNRAALVAGAGAGSAPVAARTAGDTQLARAASGAAATRAARSLEVADREPGLPEASKPVPQARAEPAATRPAQQPPPPGRTLAMPVSAAGVAELYASVGRQLKALDEAHGASATEGLWSLYLQIHINDVISNPSKLADASAVLYHIEDQVSRRSAQTH